MNMLNEYTYNDKQKLVHLLKNIIYIGDVNNGKHGN